MVTDRGEGGDMVGVYRSAGDGGERDAPRSNFRIE